MAARIIVDDRFKSGALSQVLLPTMAGSEAVVRRSDLTRAEAVIRLRIAEESVARKSSEEADRDASAAGYALKSSLMFNPADSFLWLMMYSQEIKRSGFDARTVGFLSQSYATGPLEGWITLRRNRLALAAFAGLAETMQAEVVAEFVAMVNSEFVEDGALNLMGVGWPHRDRLLASLVDVDLIPREAFAKKLSREGLKVSVPGVELDDRLWR
ncbi:hypothetical protein ABH995_005343 [Bradyrhizobium yuanmingense]|uniref:hypothetical protein n=1 Tax=Bradyrhizobium yuanmingense TaxID=108015 RepID=UPI0035133BFD